MNIQEKTMRLVSWCIWAFAIILWMLIVVLSSTDLHAQGLPDLSWFNVDGGGAVSSAEGYTLRGVAGQADAGQQSAGDYTLTGGVLAVSENAPPSENPDATIFLPRVGR